MYVNIYVYIKYVYFLNVFYAPLPHIRFKKKYIFLAYPKKLSTASDIIV